MEKRFTVKAMKNGVVKEVVHKDNYDEAYEYYYEFAWRSKYDEFDRIELIDRKKPKKEQKSIIESANKETIYDCVEELSF